MKRIEIDYGLSAQVSDEDYDRCLAINWWLAPKDATVYARGNVDGVETYMHRFIANEYAPFPDRPDLVVDHIDGWGLNNRRDNLRWLTQAQNVRNPHSCRFKGVRRHRKNPRRWEYYNYSFNEWMGDHPNAFDAARTHDWEAVRLDNMDLLNFPRHFARSYCREYPELPSGETQ